VPKTEAEKTARKIAKLEAFIADKSHPKAERKAAKAELAERREAALAAPPVEPSPDVEQGPTPAAVIAAADRVLAEPNASPGARESADRARTKALAATMKAEPEPAPVAEPVDDGEVAARVQAKRLLRKAGLVTESETGGALIVDPDAVPRYNPALVAAYNRVVGVTTGHYLTSDDERAAIDARVKAPAAAEPEPIVEPERESDDDVDAPQPEPERVAVEVVDLGPVLGLEPEPVTIAEHEAVAVETEKGREFAVGPPVGAAAHDIAKPSEAPVALEQNGLGQYKIKHPDTGKIVGYTRVTTYIANLEDTSALDKWKQRILLEGLVANETAVGTTERSADAVPPHLLSIMRDAIHERELAIAKARKADRKGKLLPGELAEKVEAAVRAFKKIAGDIAQQALDLGGVRDAATKGTDLHALTELCDEHGLDAVQVELDAGRITPADYADIAAYDEAMRRAGLKVLEREIVVVDDARRVAGRLDKIVLGKATADAARASRMVADVKTGRIDYGAGKIAQQLGLYAGAKAYDLETHERRAHGASRTIALLIHLPAGTATCFIYAVDLKVGAIGNRLSGEVRAWRSAGKKAVSAVDLAAPHAGGAR